MRTSVAAFGCGLLFAACVHSASPPALPADVTTRIQAEGYQSLHSFGGGPRDGAHPLASLLAQGGQLYGTTMNGGKNDVGTVYRVSNSGVEHVLYSFPIANNGKVPESNLTVLHGPFYGTTYGGGGTDCIGGCGTVFQITSSGSEKIIYAFTGSTDGANPIGGLVAIKGRLYGTTLTGGCAASSCVGSCNCGTVFAVALSGKETQLHTFTGPNTDGAFPESGLTYVKGMLYGVTLYNVFKIGTDGAFAVVHQFRGGADGSNAKGDLLADAGALYGTTETGGSGCKGAGCGTVFRLNASGKEQVLYRFKGGADGRNPIAGLIASAGTLYGTTTLGGRCTGNALGCGTIFALSESTGAERVLYRFKGGQDGASPGRGTLTYVNGVLYGSTDKGGDTNTGTIFKFVL